MRTSRARSGFALVITVLLLGLLVLVVYCLSALSRVGANIAEVGGYQVQARQHALLGLSQALGGLQRYAAEDEVLTGMGGIGGTAEGANQPARHWCGVWDRNAQFFRWLASGEDGVLLPNLGGPDAVELVGSGSVGADGNDREHVRVLALPVVATSRDRGPVTLGRYAWWVGDEGVKLSAVLPAEKHGLDELITLAPDAALLDRALSYEQVALVPTTITPTALAGQLRANFHALGRTHTGLIGQLVVPGRLNVNSTSARYWRGVAATYNRLKPAAAPALAPASFGLWMRDHVPLADPGAGKTANGPYPAVDLFLNSTALSGALGESGGSLLAFGDVMRPWLTVRSDTFRIRAWGAAANPAEPVQTEARAWCEAIVQRVKDPNSGSRGRFIITYFRWLGPEDITAPPRDAGEKNLVDFRPKL